MSKIIIFAAVAAVLAGCETGACRYGNVDDDVYGSKCRLEYPQRSRAVTEMVERLLTDPDFTDLYAVATERAAKRGHRRPTVVIREIEDNTRAGVSDSRATGQIHRELKTALRKTKKFAVIDLGERTRMANIASAEADGGAKSDNLQAFGEYESGDFHISGELTSENVGGKVYYHFLNLRMTDPITGGEIWNDTVKVRKE